MYKASIQWKRAKYKLEDSMVYMRRLSVAKRERKRRTADKDVTCQIR